MATDNLSQKTRYALRYFSRRDIKTKTNRKYKDSAKSIHA